MLVAIGAIFGLSLSFVLGVGAGVITTVAGFGGGLVLNLALAPWTGPASALAISSPALALGHLHRSRIYRDAIDHGVVRLFVLGAAPAAILGALVAAAVPEAVLAGALLVGALLAVVQAIGWIPAHFGRRAVVPGAAGVGFLAASCGGGGVLLPPTLMSAGLGGRAFVATAALGALVVQCVRIVAYGWAGMLALGQVPWMAAAGVGLLVGNLVGKRAANRLDDEATARWTRGTLALAVALGLGTVLRAV